MATKGFFKPANRHKYNGDSTNIVYRSSWELKLMMHLDTDPNVISWDSEEVRIPYYSPIDGRIHTYFPDFRVVKRNPDGVIETVLIEVKPNAQTKPPKPGTSKTRKYINEVKTWGVNSAKWKAAQSLCEARGWKFIIMDEYHLGIK